MSTHTTRRRARALALATASAMLSATVIAVATPATAAVSAATTSTTTTSGSVVLTPSVVPTSAAEIANPMRGQYRWMGYGADPSTWPAPDLYYRDQTYWGRLEATKGKFDFSALDAGLADAGSKQAKFGFRVMAYCPGCWMNSRTDWPSVVPSWMPVDANGVPRWNDATFLSEWENLMATLGARYGNDPRLGYVDVGGFGKYGEWTNAGDALTLASAQRIIAAVAKAFPAKHVLLSAVTDYTLYGGSNVLQWGLDTYPNLGVRSDCLGNPYMQKPDGAFADVWKSRPFFTEWCTDGDPVLGRDQVKQYHVSTTSSHNMRLTWSAMTSTQQAAYADAVKSAGYRYAVTTATLSTVSSGQPFTVSLTVNNAGVAPTYDPWTVRLVLRDSTGARVATLALPIELRWHLPGAWTYSNTLTAPSLPTGAASASVEVVDPSGYSAPMQLANGGRASDGSYPLGSLTAPATTVARGSATSWPRDVTGDHHPDVVAVEAGTGALRVYPTSGTGRWLSSIRDASNWSGYDRVLTAGLWDGDGVSDVIARDAAGVLYLRRGTTSGTFGPPEEIGRGWQVYDLIIPVGDFDGDGNADLLARGASDGSLWLYRGDGAGGVLSSRAIGSGWGGFDAIIGVGDFTGDGAVDVVARSPRGYLYLYPGNGRGSWLRYSRIGTGWQIFNALTAVGDFDGDRRADVLGRRTDGTLWLYRGNGKGGWLSYAKVGAGWQMFSTILH